MYKEKKYIINNKRLMEEWDWENNEKINLNPSTISEGSNLRPWWKCKNGHRWQAPVNHRASGTDCPYCSGRLAIQGETDLETINPSLASEWHPTKNGTLTPKDVKPQSNKKVWWLCDKGHEYEAKINNRSNGTGCPVCWNELHTSFPEQAIFFYLNKYFLAKSREIVSGKEVDVYLPDIKVGIEYDGNYFHSSEYSKKKEFEKDRILNENGIKIIHIKESNENKVSNEVIYYIYNTKHSNLDWVISTLLNMLGINTQDIDIERDRIEIYELYICTEKENSFANIYPELLKEWNYDKNKGLMPEMVRPFSNKIVWWICEKKHEWQESVANRTSGNYSCPICSGHQVLAGYNDLQTKYPELISEWDYDKNGDLSPTSIMPKSSRKVWWICKFGHEYESRIHSRTSGQGCPYCASKKVLEGFNDLKTTNPKLALEWNYEKNGSLLPSMVTQGSHKKVWWKCNNGHEWESSIHNRSKGRGCPECAKTNRLSKYELDIEI